MKEEKLASTEDELLKVVPGLMEECTAVFQALASIEGAEPNEETKKAIVHALAVEKGLVPDNAIVFHSAEDAIAYLESL